MTGDDDAAVVGPFYEVSRVEVVVDESIGTPGLVVVQATQDMTTQPDLEQSGEEVNP
jgi:hypothetical protein